MENKKLNDEFHNEELNHFSYLDYLQQLQTNGQNSEIKKLLREFSNHALLLILDNDYLTGYTRRTYLYGELLERMA